MGTKISKSDITPAEEAQEAAARARLRQARSQHFLGGTYVVHNRRRAEVIDRLGGGEMVVGYDDTGEVEILRPFALQWEPDTRSNSS